MTKTKAKLVVLRHGQTEYNKNHWMTGQRDVSLTFKGEQQARAAGKLLRDIKFDKVYSSTLSRAFNTAALALAAAKTQNHLRRADDSFDIDQRQEVIELDTGRFTGHCHKTDKEVLEFSKTVNFDKPLPDGESPRMVLERVKKFLDVEVLPRLARGENILIVTHAGVVRLMDMALGLEATPAPNTNPPRKHVNNAAPVVYEFEDGKAVKSYPIAENDNGPDKKIEPKIHWTKDH